MKGIDARGLPKTVLVKTRSLFEAAAQGSEKLHGDGGCRFEQFEGTVHEARGTFAVRPRQLVCWLGNRAEGETIGVTALKRRVHELLHAAEQKPTILQTRKERRQQ